MKNKKRILFAAILMFSLATHAQTVTLPPFTKWATNNSPDCKNVSLAKDSMVLSVKNKCRSEGILANWRPSVNVSADQLHYTIPAGSAVKLTITYKFKPVGGDVLSFYGSFDPESDNSDIAFSRNLAMKDGTTSLPASDGYTKAVLWINFSNESEGAWTAATALKGSMNFDFNVTSNGGETHQGSVAVIKDVKLEITK